MKKNYYGPLYYWWDECEETVSIGEDLAIELIKKENFIGKTYIDVMSSEYGIPVIDLTEKEVKDLAYEINDFTKGYYVKFQVDNIIHIDITTLFLKFQQFSLRCRQCLKVR